MRYTSYISVLAFLLLVSFSFTSCDDNNDNAQGPVELDLQLCFGDFALCAASICTPIPDETILVISPDSPGGIAEFDVAQCICPIFPGPGLAIVNSGNMGIPLGPGNCTRPTIVNGMDVGDDGIWSYYQQMGNIPQEINDWSQDEEESNAPYFVCPADPPNTFANCFNFACERAGEINGVQVATCFCPIGESLQGTVIAPGTEFGTEAGQCNENEDICSQLPVGAVFKIEPFAPESCTPID